MVEPVELSDSSIERSTLPGPVWQASPIPFPSESAWSALGIASYRSGDYKAAVAELQQGRKLIESDSLWGSYFDFHLAMACWKNGDKEEARKYYGEADAWLKKNQPGNPGWPRIVVEKLRRFRTEADEVMGISKSDIKG